MDVCRDSGTFKSRRRYKDYINLLITDVIMPKLGGIELAQQVAALYPEIRVLYVSGYTENAIVKGGFLESNIHFLMKPFTPETLLQKVNEMLSS
jgi:two-component system, cell cycle sensor histidine kinase and response regulator CckA